MDHDDRLCTACEVGYYLKTNRVCATSTADGCLVATYANSTKCKEGKCKEGYFYDATSGTCKTTPISGCLETEVYEKADKTLEFTCSKCDTNFHQSTDRKTCIFDKTCKELAGKDNQCV